MEHLSELELSLLVDGALTASEAASARSHIDLCSECSGRLQALQAETSALKRSLVVDPGDAPQVPVPAFSRPAGFREFALANVATGVVIWAAQFLWKTVFGELAMNALTWATSVYLPDIYDVTTETLLYLLNEGTAMFDAYLETIVLIAVTLLVTSAAWYYRHAQRASGVCLLVLLAATLAAPPVDALEVRRDEGVVTIAADEVIDDTLVVAADTIRIEGTVNGDVIAAGRSIDVSGAVAGSVWGFGESVEFSGQVGGSVVSGGNSVRFQGASVTGDVLGMGEKVVLDENTSVSRNAIGMGNSITVEGKVGKDLFAFGEVLELSGAVEEDLEAFAGRVRLLGEGRIGGDARLRSAEDRFHRDATTEVGGEVSFLAMPESIQTGSRYATLEFYLWQVARLLSAFLVGLALFWLIPALRRVALAGGIEGVKTAGLGLVFIVSVPVVAVLVGFTLVGIPFSIIGVIFWALALYLAKIVVGGVVGRMVTGDESNRAVALLAGLAIVILAINLPFIGGIVNFVLTIVGVGLLVQFLLAAVSRPPQASTPA